MNKKELLHADKYIYWAKEAEKIQVNHNEWNDLVDKLNNSSLDEILDCTNIKTVRSFWRTGSYYFNDKNLTTYPQIYVYDKKPFIFSTNIDETKNDSEHITGTKAYKEIEDRFKIKYNVSLSAAFGKMLPDKNKRYLCDKKVDGKNVYDYDYVLRQCNDALPAMISVALGYSGNIFVGSKADISSAYPWALTLPLPNANKMEVLEGAVEPKNGWISYWTKSGHIIEGCENGVDTRKLLKHKYYSKRHCFKEIADEVTIMMPYSEYSLKDIMQDLYEKRKVDETAKGAMVSFIGYLRSCKDYRYFNMNHISAIVYARHIIRMCDIYDKLVEEGNEPILFATDSIIWKGGKSSTTTTEKTLGAFVSEYENCKIGIHGCGVYAIETQDGKLAVCKHQGVGQAKWDKKDIKTLKEFMSDINTNGIEEEYYDKVSHKFVIRKKIYYGF